MYKTSVRLKDLISKLSANQFCKAVAFDVSVSSTSLNLFVTSAKVISPSTGVTPTLEGKLNNTTAFCNLFIYCSGCGIYFAQVSQKAYISRAKRIPPGAENR